MYMTKLIGEYKKSKYVYVLVYKEYHYICFGDKIKLLKYIDKNIAKVLNSRENKGKNGLIYGEIEVIGMKPLKYTKYRYSYFKTFNLGGYIPKKKVKYIDTLPRDIRPKYKALVRYCEKYSIDLDLENLSIKDIKKHYRELVKK